MKKLKRYIEFYRFERRVNKVNNSIPSYEKLKEYIVYDWESLSKFNLRITHSKMKEVLPLKTLIVEGYYPTIPSIHIKYDREEFNKVMKNKCNTRLIKLLLTYINSNRKERNVIYENNKDTFILLLDCIETKYYLDKEKEISIMIEYLMESFKEINLVDVEHQDIDSRVKFELEFIKMQREKKRELKVQ